MDVFNLMKCCDIDNQKVMLIYDAMWCGIIKQYIVNVIMSLVYFCGFNSDPQFVVRAKHKLLSVWSQICQLSFSEIQAELAI